MRMLTGKRIDGASVMLELFSVLVGGEPGRVSVGVEDPAAHGRQ